jgi:hypothetical protein
VFHYYYVVFGIGVVFRVYDGIKYFITYLYFHVGWLCPSSCPLLSSVSRVDVMHYVELVFSDCLGEVRSR